ncbi:Hypothetical predicted protein [Olea europaea subsp. europaea]|uniref:Uncharacterized protein n=1 Tax=Olea europaea subsp. europaea TaxID=158383 RepID=A0A8S0T7E8_OLEEU|nr:Hypothetical predicted protein [Olea europaea subsp. europaea]
MAVFTKGTVISSGHTDWSIVGAAPLLDEKLAWAGMYRSGRVLVVAWMQAHSQVPSGIRRAGHIRMLAHFQAFLGSFWDKAMSRMALGHGGDAGFFQAYEGSMVCRPCQGRKHVLENFLAISGIRCAGHAQDASWPQPCPGLILATVGVQADFQAHKCSMVCRPCQRSKNVPRHSGQYMGHGCRPCLPDSQAFLGSFWVTVCRLCPRRGRDTSLFSGLSRPYRGMRHDFQAFLGSFWGTVCRPCPGCILATVGTQVNFQALEGRTVVSGTRCAGLVQDAIGMQPDFHAFLGSFTGMTLSGCLQATVGAQPDFQAFLDNFWVQCAGQVVSGTQCAGHVQDAVVMQPDFQAFLSSFIGTAVSGTRCAGHVRDASWLRTGKQPIFQAFLGSFWDTVCKPCPRRDKDVAWLSSISWKILGHGAQTILGRVQATVGTQPDFQAMSKTRLGPDRDAGQFLGTRRPDGAPTMLEMQTRSQAFWAVFGTRCAGHVPDVVGT